MSLCRIEVVWPSSQSMVTPLQDTPTTVPRSVALRSQQTRSSGFRSLDWSPVIRLFRYDSQPTFARTFLAGCGVYFAARLDRLPYLGKSSAFARGAVDFCACFFWIWSFHKIYLRK